MTLLKLIFFEHLSLHLFEFLFDNIFIYLFLIIIYKKDYKYNNNLEPINMFINLINLIMHLTVYQLNIFVNKLNKTKYGSLIMYSYNYLNLKVINIKFFILDRLIFNPIKFFIKKTIIHILKNNMKINENKVYVDNLKIKINTNDEINYFLNRLLEKQNRK